MIWVFEADTLDFGAGESARSMGGRTPTLSYKEVFTASSGRLTGSKIVG